MRPEPGHVREEWLCYSVSGVTNGFGVSKVRAWPLATRLHLVELGARVRQYAGNALVLRIIRFNTYYT